MGHKITILPDGLAGNNIAAPGVGVVITIFLVGLAITSAAIAWLYLLVRKTLLLVAIVFAPLAFSGSSWVPRWVDQHMGDARGRADPFQARAGRDRSGHHPHQWGTVLHQ